MYSNTLIPTISLYPSITPVSQWWPLATAIIRVFASDVMILYKASWNQFTSNNGHIATWVSCHHHVVLQQVLVGFLDWCLAFWTSCWRWMQHQHLIQMLALVPSEHLANMQCLTALGTCKLLKSAAVLLASSSATLVSASVMAVSFSVEFTSAAVLMVV